jgi:hypothetical protein
MDYARKKTLFAILLIIYTFILLSILLIKEFETTNADQLKSLNILIPGIGEVTFPAGMNANIISDKIRHIRANEFRKANPYYNSFNDVELLQQLNIAKKSILDYQSKGSASFDQLMFLGQIRQLEDPFTNYDLGQINSDKSYKFSFGLWLKFFMLWLTPVIITYIFFMKRQAILGNVNKLNGWQRIFVVLAIFYFIIVNWAVIFFIPTQSEIDNNQVTEIITVLRDEIPALHNYTTSVLRNIYNNIGDKELIERLYTKYSDDPTLRLNDIQDKYNRENEFLLLNQLKWVVYGFIWWIIPLLIVYLFGWSIGWVSKGFKTKQ